MRWLTAAVVAAVLALLGCGARTSDTTHSGTQEIGTGKVADLDFAGTTLSGEPFRGAALQGEPAVLWFWAPWCPTCRAQSGNVSTLAQEYEGRVAVVGVGGLDSQAAIEQVALEIPHVTHLLDPGGDVWRHFGVTAQSTYTVVSADGEIMAEGYLDDDELNDLVARLVA
jgi:thiol-disulfide isomerase/thioredoxin